MAGAEWADIWGMAFSELTKVCVCMCVVCVWDVCSVCVGVSVHYHLLLLYESRVVQACIAV